MVCVRMLLWCLLVRTAVGTSAQEQWSAENNATTQTSPSLSQSLLLPATSTSIPTAAPTIELQDEADDEPSLIEPVDDAVAPMLPNIEIRDKELRQQPLPSSESAQPAPKMESMTDKITVECALNRRCNCKTDADCRPISNAMCYANHGVCGCKSGYYSLQNLACVKIETPTTEESVRILLEDRNAHVNLYITLTVILVVAVIAAVIGSAVYKKVRGDRKLRSDYDEVVRRVQGPAADETEAALRYLDETINERMQVERDVEAKVKEAEHKLQSLHQLIDQHAQPAASSGKPKTGADGGAQV